jgi:hypothetical protein
LQGRGTAGIVGFVMALAACYGTLALAAFLPLVGLRLAVNDTVWVGAILVFTLLALLAVLAGFRSHRSAAAALAAVAGAGLVAFAMLVAYHPIVELAGFVLLGAAVWRDAWLRRRLSESPAA